jgi:hypothetical protein
MTVIYHVPDSLYLFVGSFTFMVGFVFLISWLYIMVVISAAEYEAIRQAQAYLAGTPTGRETRTFHVPTQTTRKIRDKGGAVDYRFLPEPDLPPLHLNRQVRINRSICTMQIMCQQ